MQQFTDLEQRLLQTMHDARIVLGFDTDGDTTPAAELAGGGVESYILNFLRDMYQVRKDHEEAVDEVCMNPAAHEPSLNKSGAAR